MSAALRMVREDDAPAIIEIYAPIVRDTATSFEQEVPSRDEICRRIRNVTAFGHWLVATETNADAHCLGYAYAGAFRERAAYRWTAESAVYVHAQHQRRGVARALYTALIEGLRIQGFHTLVAGVTLPNPASVRLHEALGYRPFGVVARAGYKHGAWHDVGFWQRSLRPAGPDAPTPILSAAQLAQHPSWHTACEQAAASIRPR